jgi:hypothetical protein
MGAVKYMAKRNKIKEKENRTMRTTDSSLSVFLG